MAITIVSINIEGDNHLERVKAFLQKEKAEVVALMEVFEDRVEELAGSEYPYTVFAPNIREELSGRDWGVAVLSKHPIIEEEKYYCGEDWPGGLVMNGKTHLPLLIMAKIEKEQEVYQMGAIHFSWTPDGFVNERQKGHAKNFLDFLDAKEELAIMGDFNIARGKNELYNLLTKRYKDNIPPELTTTIDPELHRVNQTERGKLALVVDYLWTSTGYKAEKVRIECGVSDHCAVVGEISRV